MSKSRGKIMNFVFLSLLAVFTFSGCSAETPKPIEQNKAAEQIKPVQQNKPAQTTADSKIKLFNGKGVVTKINLELVSVELDHEAIENLMPAMRMEFYVKEKSELETLKVGDNVDFVLEDNAGQEKITSIKKADEK